MGAISLSSVKNMIDKAKPSTSNNTSSQSGKSAIGGLTNGVTDTVNNTADYISKAETSIGNIVGDSAESLSNYLSSGISSVESGIGDIAGSIGNSVSSLFKSKSDNKSSDIATNSKDPLKTSTLNGTPQSKLFTTSSQYAQTEPINLQNKQASGLGGLTAGLSTMVKRVGSAVSTTESSMMQLASSITHNSLIDGLYHEAGSVISDVSDTITGVEDGISSVQSQVSSIVGDFTRSYSDFFGSLGISSNSLGDFIDYSLPGTADSQGNTVKGIPASIGSDKLNVIYGAFKSLGCNINNPNYVKYGAEQSFKNTLLAMTSHEGLTDAFSQALSCGRFQDLQSMKTVAAIFKQQAANNPTIANLASKAIDNPSQTPISDSLARDMVTNPNLQYTDATQIKEMFDRMTYSPQRAYSVSESAPNVYDSDILRKGNRQVSTALLGANIADIANDIEVGQLY